VSLAAILLAGGRATRVDGAAKPLFDVGGRTLLHRAVDAVLDAGADDVVVVGPVLDEALPVRWLREDPPFGGPAAAIATALATTPPSGTSAEWTVVLACDLPRPDAAVSRLITDLPLLPRDTDGVCLADAGSRPQWLTGIYRTDALRRAAASLPDGGRDAPVRALLDDLAIAVVRVPDDVVADVDTWEDLDRARRATDLDRARRAEEDT
jgi:molybdopterin-guanine dinucleotide biosynthesis protein A